jgi:hypothetical protein
MSDRGWGRKKDKLIAAREQIDVINPLIIMIIQGVIESCTDILTTSHWLHVELGNFGTF